MYSVFDYYENPFGDRIFVNKDYKECFKFLAEFIKETDGECKLVIKDENGKTEYEAF